jgi:hypothetical protein
MHATLVRWALEVDCASGDCCCQVCSVFITGFISGIVSCVLNYSYVTVTVNGKSITVIVAL